MFLVQVISASFCFFTLYYVVLILTDFSIILSIFPDGSFFSRILKFCWILLIEKEHMFNLYFFPKRKLFCTSGNIKKLINLVFFYLVSLFSKSRLDSLMSNLYSEISISVYIGLMNLFLFSTRLLVLLLFLGLEFF